MIGIIAVSVSYAFSREIWLMPVPMYSWNIKRLGCPIAAYAAGEAKELPLMPSFDRRIELEFQRCQDRIRRRPACPMADKGET
jgi:hypothetical protein